jgi:glycosyltransferase involved in cell wall biosynthesis
MDIQLSIVMPCLNEEETLAVCIRKAYQGMRDANITGEVVVADNGSRDASCQIATQEGARVVHVVAKGYGHALRAGITAAHGKWILMGDADDSYDFSAIKPFIEKLREGWELVMGCRLPAGGGTVMPGAMPWKHRWIGNPALSFIGRLFFGCPAHDFHCGLRAFTKEGFDLIDLRTTGMELASELVIKATLRGLRITEVPITLYPDGRSRAPHLRSWRDGWRHLRFMLLFSPRWLFLIPGISISSLGLAGFIPLSLDAVALGKVTLDLGALMGCALLLLVGFQLICFAIFTRVFAVAEGLLPRNQKLEDALDSISLEWGLILGMTLSAIGVAMFGMAVWDWYVAGFGTLSLVDNLRRIIPASTLVMLGVQILFGSFFIGVLGLKSRNVDETAKQQPTGSAP